MLLKQTLQRSLAWRTFYFITVFIVNIALAKSLGAVGIADLLYLSNLFSLLLLLVSISMESGFIYFSANKQISKHSLAWLGLLWVTIVSLVLYFLLPTYFSFIEKQNIVANQSYSNWGLLYISGILLINFYSSLFYTENNFYLPNYIIGIINLFLAFIIFIGCLIDAEANIVMRDYFFFVFVQGIMVAISFIIKQGCYKHIQLPNKKQLSLLFTYVATALVANIVFFLVYRVDYWFVKYNCPAADAGNYMQAAKFAQLLWVVPQMLAAAVFPQTAANVNEQEITTTIFKLCKLFVQVFALVFIIIAIVGKTIFVYLLGSSFAVLYLPLLILIPGVLALSMLCLLSAYFAGVGRVKINVNGALAGLAVVIILSIAALHWYNIYIAATISSLGYFVCFYYSFRIFKQTHRFALLDLFVFDKKDWQWAKQTFLHKA